MYFGSVRSGRDVRSAEVIVISGGGHREPSSSADQRVVPEVELESLMDIAPRWTDEFGVPSGLIAHAIRDARESRLLGDTPETWSPLASATRFDEFGRWRAREQLARRLSELGAGDEQSTAFFNVGRRIEDATVVSLEVAGRVATAFAYDTSGFIVPVPVLTDNVVSRPVEK